MASSGQRPEVKALALGLGETTGALLVGCGARTLTLLDTLEAAADGWLTAGASAFAATGRPLEFTRAHWKHDQTACIRQTLKMVWKYIYRL